jgi:hypothetical protein
MTTPVTSILQKTWSVLQDDGTRWTESELLTWLNEGQLVLVKAKPDAKSITVEHQLAPGARQTLPVDCIQIIDVRRNVGGSAVTPCDRAALDTFTPNWMFTPIANSVKHWMPDGNPDQFFVYPAQSATPAKVELTASAYPAQVTAADNIDIRDTYRENLVNYCLARAYAKDAEHAGNAALAGEYLKLALS